MTPRKKKKRYRYDRLIAVNAAFLVLVIAVILVIRTNERNAQLALPVPKGAFAEERLVQSLGTDPKKIFIPKIGVEADIDPVGIAENGNMSLPRKLESVGWYKYGASPGEVGNAVLAGHFDNGKGKPGIFYNLKNLEIGDEVFVEDGNGGRVLFIVTETKLVDYENPPLDILERVFGETEEENLVLVTCEGAWVPEKHSYTERLIVFAKKAQG